MKLLLNVVKDNKKVFLDENSKEIKIHEEKVKLGKRITITFKPEEKITYKKAVLTLKQDYKEDDSIMANGYQSWSDTREHNIHEVEKGPSGFVPILETICKLTGDNRYYKYSKKKGVIHSVTYGYIRNNYDYKVFGSLIDTKCYTFFEMDTNNNVVNVIEDIADVEETKERVLFDFVILEGKKDEVFDEYFSLMNIKPIVTTRVKGFTSWYNYYKNINEEIILRNLDNFKKFSEQGNKVDIFQIDDGYMYQVGDWLDLDVKKFPNGLKPIAEKINESFTSGLWLAPLTVSLKSKVAKNHKDYLLKDKNGKLVVSFSSCGPCYVLDIYNEGARNYIKHFFDVVFNEWHFKMVKLDFLYAECVIPRKDKPRAEVMRDAMVFLRECCGNHPILGCGLPLASGYGLVEYCRTGCDVSLDYGRGWHLNKEAVSTYNDMLDSISREVIAKRAFLNDPDVFLLRSDNIKMTDNEKKVLSVVNAIFGDVLFTSDDFSLYPSDETFEFLKYIWHLNDSKIDKYLIIDSDKVDVDITLDNKKYKYLINASDKAWNYLGKEIEPRNYIFIEK